MKYHNYVRAQLGNPTRFTDAESIAAQVCDADSVADTLAVYVYPNGGYIQELSPEVRAAYKGRFYLVIGRSEYVAEDLHELAPLLADYVREEYGVSLDEPHGLMRSLALDLDEWTQTHALPQQCAFELSQRGDITKSEREALTTFCKRWDEITEGE